MLLHLSCCALFAAANAAAPVPKVYIMMGQSNMLGEGKRMGMTNGTLEFRGTAPGFQVVSVRVLAPAGEAPRVDAIIAAVLSPGADGTPALACNVMMGADCQPGSGCKF